MSNLALILRAQDDLTGARELQEQVNRSPPPYPRRGTTSRATLTSMNNLAETTSELKGEDDLTGARKLQERVLEVRRRIQGEEHPATLTSMNNLAETLRAQGEGDLTRHPRASRTSSRSPPPSVRRRASRYTYLDE